MAGNILDFKLEAVADPFVPPSGYTIVGGAGKIFNTGIKYWVSTATDSFCRDDLTLTGTWISSKIRVGAVTASPSGAALLLGDDGYTAITSNVNTVRIFEVLNGVTQTGAVLWTSTSFTLAVNDEIELRRNTSSGEMLVFRNGAQLLNGSGQTVTDNTYAPNMAAAHSRFGYVSTLESVYVPAFTLDTLTDPLVAGAALSGTSTGFANGAATLSSNGLSVAVTLASGAFSGTWPQAVDAQPYPTLPKTGQVITLTQSGNTATINSDLDPAAGHEIVNFVSPITDDDTYPAYYIEQDGFTAEGGQFVYVPYSDLTMDADSGVTVTGEGDLVGYFIPATGTGAGNAYYYTFHVIDGGAVVSGGRDIASSAFTVLSITASAITAVTL